MARSQRTSQPLRTMRIAAAEERTGWQRLTTQPALLMPKLCRQKSWKRTGINVDVEDKKPKTSDRLPYIEELRDSQKRGSMGCGLPENETGKLNEVQGHEVDCKE